MEQDIERPENLYPKGGRGHLVEHRFPKNWKEIMINLGKEGKNNSAIFIALGFQQDSHYELLKRNEEYADAYNEYLKHCEEWWFEKARESYITGKSKMFNQHLWANVMKNKFKDNWKDETQLDVTSKGEKIDSPDPIKIEIIRRKLNED